MPGEWDSDRQKLRARAQRKMGLWALGSGCVVVTVLYGSSVAHRQATLTPASDCPKHFAGDSPVMNGSCWCGPDTYCMCTPSLAIDTIVEVTSPTTGEVDRILVIRRKDNGKLACIGGFVEVGETLEAAVKREVLEETGLSVTSMRILPRVYDNPSRDDRRHTVSVVYVVRVAGVPKPGTEEQAVVPIPLETIQEHLDGFAFDHSQILSDYLISGITALTPDPLDGPTTIALPPKL